MTSTTSRIVKNLQNAVRGTCSGKNGGQYYDGIGAAIDRIDYVLSLYSHRIDSDDWNEKTNGIDFSWGNVSVTCEVRSDSDDHTCNLACTFYRMPSGRYELNAYVV